MGFTPLQFTFGIRKARLHEKALLEAVILRTGDTPHPWLMAGDANMDPDAYVCAESGSKNEL